MVRLLGMILAIVTVLVGVWCYEMRRTQIEEAENRDRRERDRRKKRNSCANCGCPIYWHAIVGRRGCSAWKTDGPCKCKRYVAVCETQCSECGWIGDIETHIYPNAQTCPNTGGRVVRGEKGAA